MKREREKNQAHTRKIYQFKKEGGEKKRTKKTWRLQETERENKNSDTYRKERERKKKKIKKEGKKIFKKVCQLHPVFPGGHPSKY